MMRETLRDVRAETRSPACSNDDYAVMYGRTGSPLGAAAEQRFPGRRATGEAVGLTRDYRAVLRRYNPDSPYDDPFVYEVTEGPLRVAEESVDEYARYGVFRHNAVDALFEVLPELGYREAETVETETYLTLAEIVDDRNDFCLALVWSLTSELSVHLSADEQQAVVETAAGLFCPTPTPNPMDAAPRHLEAVGLVEGYSVWLIPDTEVAGTAGPDARTDVRTDGNDSSRTQELTFGDYALAERIGRVPMPPLVVALIRRTPEQTMRFLDGEAPSDKCWRPRPRMSPKSRARHASGSMDLASAEVTENRWFNDPSTSLGR